MRKLVLLAAVGAALATPPAGATSGGYTNFRLEARPCAVLCAYWVDAPTTDVDGDGEPDVHFDVCTAPFPQGSYVDIVVTAPYGANRLAVDSYPIVEWDTFVCSTDPDDGFVVVCGGCSFQQRCDTLQSPIGLGCRESIYTPVIAGHQYTIRAYNWSDPFPLFGRYGFFTE